MSVSKFPFLNVVFSIVNGANSSLLVLVVFNIFAEGTLSAKNGFDTWKLSAHPSIPNKCKIWRIESLSFPHRLITKVLHPEMMKGLTLAYNVTVELKWKQKHEASPSLQPYLQWGRWWTCHANSWQWTDSIDFHRRVPHINRFPWREVTLQWTDVDLISGTISQQWGSQPPDLCPWKSNTMWQ